MEVRVIRVGLVDPAVAVQQHGRQAVQELPDRALQVAQDTTAVVPLVLAVEAEQVQLAQLRQIKLAAMAALEWFQQLRAAA